MHDFEILHVPSRSYTFLVFTGPEGEVMVEEYTTDERIQEILDVYDWRPVFAVMGADAALEAEISDVASQAVDEGRDVAEAIREYFR